MSKRWQQLGKNFSTSDDGAIAVLFSLMTFAMFLVSALAVDYGRANDMRTRIASSIDNASLAAGRAMLDGKLSDGEISDLAKKYFRENVKSVKKLGTIGEANVSINRKAGTVDIDVASSIKLTLARVAGFQTMGIPVSSSATYKQRDVEVGMALDITGSMDEVVGGKRKIDALKAAFQQFADRIIPDQQDAGYRARIGLAPYSAGINLGKYASLVSEKRSTDGCVTERRSGAQTDMAVGSAIVSPNPSAFLVSKDGKDDIDNSDGQTPKGAYTCPSASLVPLTDDKDALVRAVNNFQAGGWTAGHFGIQWAWNLVSDQWGSTWGGGGAPDSYSRVSDEKLIKAVVLMTDGSFNTAFHGDKATNGNWSKTQAVSLCNAMKASGKGVVVFSVAFNAPLDAQKTLKACASAGTGYYVNANSPKELEDAFNGFAAKLTQLRISK